MWRNFSNPSHTFASLDKGGKLDLLDSPYRILTKTMTPDAQIQSGTLQERMGNCDPSSELWEGADWLPALRSTPPFASKLCLSESLSERSHPLSNGLLSGSDRAHHLADMLGTERRGRG